ncbi:hypothetical protein TorRG33x02_090390 [Trema orientale]|uniref:Uncharacterized protein n=1 Tax=Trema orientale TaxID=63057 RepID=A0A2P5FBJ0_TREOI|nr:hypothetical protein TorRG33x02_090390 [Trema orientale]
MEPSLLQMHHCMTQTLRIKTPYPQGWHHHHQQITLLWLPGITRMAYQIKKLFYLPNFDEVPQLIQDNKNKYDRWFKYNIDGATVAEIEGRDADPSTDNICGLEAGVNNNDDVV